MRTCDALLMWHSKRGHSGQVTVLTSDDRCVCSMRAFEKATDEVLGEFRSALDRTASFAGGLSDLLAALRGQVAMRLLAGVTQLLEARHLGVDQHS